jgi:hypothetical protein
MSSFLEMKKNRANAHANLVKNLADSNKKGGYDKDDRFYYPERDAQGNGYAVIRFLAEAEGNNAPFVKIYRHGFKAQGGWLIEECPTTVGKPCPVCEANNDLWNSGEEPKKQLARDRKRKIEYIANILVVSDPKNPENEGKIKLFKFGQKIFDMIYSAANPEFPDQSPINAFDFWEGANFKLRIIKKDGNTNYDKSGFDTSKSRIAESDEAIEAIWKQANDLRPFTDETKFKGYDELKIKLAKVLRVTAPSGTAEGVGERSAPPARQERAASAPSAPSDDGGDAGGEGACAPSSHIRHSSVCSKFRLSSPDSFLVGDSTLADCCSRRWSS